MRKKEIAVDTEEMTNRPCLGDIAAALVSGEGLATHCRTASYFSAFLGSLGCVSWQWPWREAWRRKPALLLAAPYSLAALVSTWRLILLFFARHQAAYATHPDPPNLFVEAYVRVSDEAPGWWWSSQLLTWVTVACPMAYLEAQRRRLPPRLALAYVTTAFLGAVSLALPPLLAHLLLLEPQGVKGGTNARRAVEVTWAVCLASAALSIVALPATVDGPRWAYITALLLLHVVLALPFGLACSLKQSDERALEPRRARAAFLSLAAFCLGAHALSSAAALRQLLLRQPGASVPSLAWALLAATWRNDCQASISIDAVLSTAAGATYTIARRPRFGAALLALSPLISPAASLALFAAAEERRHELNAARRAHVD